MAVQIDATKLKVFEGISRFPSLDKMLALSPEDFELFVAYVFTCAGYDVEHMARKRYPEGPGVDLDLYASTGTTRRHRLVARVEVRRYAPRNLIALQAVREFAGTLQIAHSVPGYLVSTSDFAPNAYQAEKDLNGSVRLINGTHLLRYIAYIGGSLVTDQTGARRTPTLVSPDYLFRADAIPRRDRAKSRVLTISNNRGGIGKTTATLNLGFALAQQGRRVLLVDMDGQASLTLALPPPSPLAKDAKGSLPPEHTHFISEYFSGRENDLAGLVQPTRFDHLWILPGHQDVQRMDSGGSAHPDKEMAFVRALHDADLMVPPNQKESGSFEWIIVDTPAAQSYYTRAAMAACHYMLIPIAVEAFAARGVNRVLDAVTAMRGLMGSGVEVLGCMITNWRPNAAAEKERQNLQNELNAIPVHLFEEKIPYDANINVAHLTTIRGGLGSIFRLRPNLSPAAKGYLDLLRAVKARIADVDKHSHA